MVLSYITCGISKLVWYSSWKDVRQCVARIMFMLLDSELSFTEVKKVAYKTVYTV